MSAPDPTPETTPAPEQTPVHWTTKLSALLFCIFCIELGVFLMVFPWMRLWDQNWFIQLRPDLAPALLSYSFRGAISGLGVLNLFVGFVEVFRLRRFAQRGAH